MSYKLHVITVLTVVFSFWAMGVSAQDVTEGIVGYWPLDGNGKDESGNGNDAKLENGAKWANNGWVNGAVEVGGARFFKGLIDEVMIYDRTLNADDIKRLATVGLPVESAGKLAITWASLKTN